MSNSSYWRGRFAILEEAAQKKADLCVSDIEDMFREAQRTVQADIERWYGRFALNNQISLTEARKLLTSGQLEEFKWSVEKYIEMGKKAHLSEAWIKQLENASARFHISRLESVQLEIQHQLELLYGNQLDSIDEHLKDVVSNGYTKAAYEIQKGIGIGWDITALNPKKVETLLSTPWTADGKTFSDRCWESKANLVSGLQTALVQGLLRGDSSQKITDAVAKQFNVSRYKAGRLVHTETTYFNAVANKESYKELGVDMVEIIETLDSHTCEICQPLDGTVIPMSQYEPGITVPPFHANCRGTTAPAIDEDIIGERAARDADGNTYYVPSDMTYKDWKKAFVDGDTTNLISMSKSSDIEWPPKGTNITNAEYKELRDYAESKGVRLNGFKNSDVDVDLAKEIIDDTAKMFDEYPKLKGTSKKPFTLELSKSMKPNDFAETNPGVTHIIKLSADAMRNKTKLAEEYKKLADAGWFVKGTDYHSIIYHEMGHIIGDMYNVDGLEIAKTILKTKNKDAVFGYLEKNISEYSISQFDGSEIISEVFSAYESGVENDFILTFIGMCDIV